MNNWIIIILVIFIILVAFNMFLRKKEETFSMGSSLTPNMNVLNQVKQSATEVLQTAGQAATDAVQLTAQAAAAKAATSTVHIGGQVLTRAGETVGNTLANVAGTSGEAVGNVLGDVAGSSSKDIGNTNILAKSLLIGGSVGLGLILLNRVN